MMKINQKRWRRILAAVMAILFTWQQISWAGEIGVVPLTKQDDKIPQAQPVNQIQAAQFQAGAAVAQLQEIEGARGVVQPALTDLDVVGPGVIDRADVEKIVSQMGQTGVGLVGDVNQDGVVDIFDVVLVSREVGKDTRQAWQEKSLAVFRKEITKGLTEEMDILILQDQYGKLKGSISNQIRELPFLEKELFFKELTSRYHEVLKSQVKTKLSKLSAELEFSVIKKKGDEIKVPLLFESVLQNTDRKALLEEIDQGLQKVSGDRQKKNKDALDKFHTRIVEELNLKFDPEALAKNKEKLLSDIKNGVYLEKDQKEQLTQKVLEQFEFITTKPEWTEPSGTVVNETEKEFSWKGKADSFRLEVLKDDKPHTNFEVDQKGKKIVIKGMSEGKYRLRVWGWGVKEGIEGPEAELAFTVELVGFWIEKLRQSQDPEKQVEAIEKLKQLGDPRAIPALVDAFGTGNEQVSVKLRSTLKDFKDLAIEPLIKGLDHQNVRVKRESTRLLGQLKAMKAVDRLIRMFEALRLDPELRADAAWALGEIGDPKAIAPLMLALEIDVGVLVRETAQNVLDQKFKNRHYTDAFIALLYHSDLDVTFKAMEILAELKEVRAVEGLIEILKGSRSGLSLTLDFDPLRRRAAWALGEIGDIRAIHALIDSLDDMLEDTTVKNALKKFERKELVRQLMDALDRKQKDLTRYEIVTLLGELKATEALDQLIFRFRNDNDTAVRIAAAQALAEIGDARAIPELMNGLGDINSDVRSAVIKALSEPNQFKKEPLIDALIAALDPKGPILLRQGTAQLLGQFKASKAVDRLIQTLRTDGEANVREKAAWALGEIGDSKAIPVVIGALTDPEWVVFLAAKEALLNRFQKEEVIDGLIAALTPDKKKELRTTIVKLLGELKATKAVKKLKEGLQDEKEVIVRESIARALGNIGDPMAIPVLIEMLVDDAESVRHLAERVLDQFKRGDVISGFINVLLNHKNSLLRSIVVERLGQLKATEAVDELLQILQNDSDIGLRADAARALGGIRDSKAIPIFIEIFAKESKVYLFKDPSIYYRVRDALLNKFERNVVIKELMAVLNSVRLRIEVIELLGELKASEAVDRLINILLTDGEAIARREAAVALGKIRDPETISSLITSLGDYFMVEWTLSYQRKDSPTLRYTIFKEYLPEETYGANVILVLKGPDGKELASKKINITEEWKFEDQLAEVMLKPGIYTGEIWLDQGTLPKRLEQQTITVPDPTTLGPFISSVGWPATGVSDAAREALVEIGLQAGEPLLQVLKSEKPAIRKVAIKALGQVKFRQAVESLIAISNNDKFLPVRIEAIRALGRIGDSRAINVLIEKLGDPKLHYAARDALAAYRFRFEEAEVIKKLVNELLNALNHANAQVRMGAAGVLGQLGFRDTKVVESLIELLKNDPEVEVRSEATWALGEIRDPLAIPALIKALADLMMIPSFRYTVRDGKVVSINLLIQKEYLPQETYGKQVTILLKDVEGRQIGSRKIQIGDEWNINVNFSEIEFHHGEFWVEVYLDQPVKGQAIKRQQLSIDPFSGTQKIFSGFAWMQLSGPGERAIHALWKIDREQVRSHLIEALKNVQPAIRIGALRTLNEMDSRPPVDKLKDMLKNDAAPRVRAEAVSTLAEFEGTLAIPALVDALGDQDEDVLTRVKQELKAKKDLAIGFLDQALKGHLNAQVRGEAALLLVDWNIILVSDDVFLAILEGSQTAKADRKERFLSKVVDLAKSSTQKQIVADKLGLNGIRREVYLQHNILLIDATASFNHVELTRIQEALNLFPKDVLKNLGINIMSRHRPEDSPDLLTTGAEAMPLEKKIKFYTLGAVNAGLIFHELAHFIFWNRRTEKERQSRAKLYVDSKVEPQKNIITQYARDKNEDEDHSEMVGAWGIDSVALLQQAEERGAIFKGKLFFDIEPFIYKGNDGIERVHLYRAGAGFSDSWGTYAISVPDAAPLTRREDMEGIVHRDKDGNIERIEVPFKGLIDDLKSEILLKRESAAKLLGVMKIVAAVEPLMEIARNDKETSVRAMAIWALGRIGDKRAIPTVIEALNDKDSKVRSNAVVALGHIGDASVVAVLIKMLGDQEWSVRDDASDALGKIGSAALESLITALEDKNLAIRAGAASTLGKIGDPRAIDPLIKALLVNEEWAVHISAARALDKIGTSAVDSLIRLLNDRDPKVRSSVVRALSEIKDPRSVELLIRALADEDSRVRNSAAYALEIIGDPRAVEPLINTLRDPEDFVRSTVAIALGIIGDIRAVDPLIKSLDDESFSVRRDVAQALGYIGDVRSLEPLLKTLKDEVYLVRESVARALGELKDPRSIEPLITALGDKESPVRLSAEQALKKIGTQKVLGPLKERIKNEKDPVIRKYMEEVLQSLET